MLVSRQGFLGGIRLFVVLVRGARGRQALVPPLLVLDRHEIIVKFLHAIDAEVMLGALLEFLQPLDSNTRPARDLAEWSITVFEELARSR
jgi:hypothetical protein